MRVSESQTYLQLSLIYLGTTLLIHCISNTETPLFTLITPKASTITFQNNITFNDSLNIQTYMYFFNGGGVAVGDINNDGLEDLYFSANQSTNRLYLNRGDFKFEDITVSAGVGTTGWSSGVAMIDINADGWQDIYVCRTANPKGKGRSNLLFINQKNGTFLEQSEAYGLADTAYSTQAAFLDYDKDGDLDVYLLNHSHQFTSTNDPLPKKLNGEAPNTDKLFRNDFDSLAGHPRFTDVSVQAGIQIEGFGLGVGISDINLDGWPDIYISNDFVSNDLLYINNQDGTFTNKIGQYLKHQSHNGMGNDLADFNNDGLVDIFVADMLPEINERRKRMATNTTFDVFNLMLYMGYEPQYTRNTLQLNRGVIEGLSNKFDGTKEYTNDVYFSEIGQLAGIHATDWSWAPLLADFDLDGYKDLLITNGYVKDLTDLDAIVYRKQASVFTTQAERDSIYLATVNELAGIYLPNYVYQNQGNLTFSNQSQSWGFSQPSFSHGAAYSDLDNDGDLDLVVNNTNAPTFLYRNETFNDFEDRTANKTHFLQLKLNGPPNNPEGIGTKIHVYHANQVQYFEQNPIRGYQSSVSTRIYIGLGNTEKIDSLIIIWPDGQRQVFKDVINDQLVVLDYNADRVSNPVSVTPSKRIKLPLKKLWIDVTKQLGFEYKREELPYVDFKTEPLIPHTYAYQGPIIAVGDMNQDNLEDFVVGGSAGKETQLFFQEESGSFTQKSLVLDNDFEDIGMLLFDADQDGDQDLYIVSGGSEHWVEPEMFQDRLYKNDGKGNFSRDTSALPIIQSSGSCIKSADFDKDGDLDLFVGGRVVPGKYGDVPQSFLLRNDNGKFTEISTAFPGLSYVGMVSNVLWTDFNNDSWIDLMIVGEWMPITFFQNQQGKLKKISPNFLSPNQPINQLTNELTNQLTPTSGWWSSINGADFDNDGDTDYILGNYGWNTQLKPSVERPITLYTGFFDDNRSWDAILCNYQLGRDGAFHSFPIHPRDLLIDQMNSLARRFVSYESYADAQIADILSPDALARADMLKANNFSSVYLENLGENKFSISPLPMEAQFSPINDIEILNLNNDEFLDLLLIGNSYSPEVSLGRQDASYGLNLIGDGKGGFEPFPFNQKGMMTDGDMRAIEKICIQDEYVWLITKNSGELKAWALMEK